MLAQKKANKEAFDASAYTGISGFKGTIGDVGRR